MKKIAYLVVIFILFSTTNSSLIALNCNGIFGDSSNDQLSTSLPEESVLQIDLKRSDYPHFTMVPLESLYFDLKNPRLIQAKFSKDDKDDNVIRRQILERVIENLETAYQEEAGYTLFVNDEKDPEEIQELTKKLRKEWGLKESSRWEEFMKTFKEIINSELLIKQYEKINSSSLNEAFESISEYDLSYPCEDYVVGADQKINELVKLMMDEDYVHILAIKTKANGKRFGREKISKEVVVVLKKLVWLFGKKVYIEKTKSSESSFKEFEQESFSDQQKDIDEIIHEETETAFDKEKEDNEIERLLRALAKEIRYTHKDTVFDSSCSATVISSNTIITSASCLKKLSWSGEIFVQKGSKKIKSIAYYIHPDYFKPEGSRIHETDEGYVIYSYDIAVVRFPEGTFDNIEHVKLGFYNVNKGTSITVKKVYDHKITKTIRDSIEMIRSVEDYEDYGDYEDFEDYEDYDDDMYGKYEPYESEKSFADSFYKDNSSFIGTPLFGTDGRLVGVFNGGFNNTHTFSMMQENEKFLKWVVKFDPKLKIRGINID